MESRDLELIQKHVMHDRVLEVLFHEHVDFEKRLAKLERKPYLTTVEERERKELQKRKLLGKDRMESILRKYRNGEYK